MEELPIKYVKDTEGKFAPITSPKAVVNEEGKNIEDLYVLKEELGTQYVFELSGTSLFIKPKGK